MSSRERTGSTRRGRMKAANKEATGRMKWNDLCLLHLPTSYELTDDALMDETLL